MKNNEKEKYEKELKDLLYKYEGMSNTDESRNKIINEALSLLKKIKKDN